MAVLPLYAETYRARKPIANFNTQHELRQPSAAKAVAWQLQEHAILVYNIKQPLVMLGTARLAEGNFAHQRVLRYAANVLWLDLRQRCLCGDADLAVGRCDVKAQTREDRTGQVAFHMGQEAVPCQYLPLSPLSHFLRQLLG